MATTSDSTAPTSTSQINSQATNTGPPRDRKRRPWRNKPPNGNTQNNALGDEREAGAQSATGASRPRRSPRPRHDRRERTLDDGQTNDHHDTSTADVTDNNAALTSDQSTPSTTGSVSTRRPGPKRGPKPPPRTEASLEEQAPNVQGSSTKGNNRGGGRRRQFNSRLTENDAHERPEQSHKGRDTHRRTHDKPDNLTNRLIDALRVPPFADCPICFNPIRPPQPIWSCSPSLHPEVPHCMLIL